jgi:hypothetical protein
MTTLAARRSGRGRSEDNDDVGASSDLAALERVGGAQLRRVVSGRFGHAVYDAYLYNKRPMIRATETGERRIALRISGLGPARTLVGGSCATTE